MYLSTFMSIALLEVFLLLLGLIFFLILHIRTLNKRLTQTKKQLQTTKAEHGPSGRSPTERGPTEVTFDTLEPAEPPAAASESTGDWAPGDWNQLLNEQLAITQQLRQQIDQEIPQTEESQAKEPLDGHVDQLEDLIYKGKGAAEQLESQIENLKVKLSEVETNSAQNISTAPEAATSDMPDRPATTLLETEPEELPDTIDMDTPLDELESFDIDSLETADIDKEPPKPAPPRRKADSDL